MKILLILIGSLFAVGGVLMFIMNLGNSKHDRKTKIALSIMYVIASLFGFICCRLYTLI